MRSKHRGTARSESHGKLVVTASCALTLWQLRPTQAIFRIKKQNGFCKRVLYQKLMCLVGRDDYPESANPALVTVIESRRFLRLRNAFQ